MDRGNREVFRSEDEAPRVQGERSMPKVFRPNVSGRARVVDGDTVEIGQTRVRFHGIDAPKSSQNCIADGPRWPCGERATRALADPNRLPDGQLRGAGPRQLRPQRGGVAEVEGALTRDSLPWGRDGAKRVSIPENFRTLHGHEEDPQSRAEARGPEGGPSTGHADTLSSAVVTNGSTC